MEWEVYVEKDLPRRNLKVWVESRGDNADERLNWFFKDGWLANEVRKIDNVMSDGLVPMFAGPLTMMQEVIGKVAEEYPSNLFVKRDEYDRLFQEKWELEQWKNAEIKKWEERFDKALDGVLRAPQPECRTTPVGELNFSPIMATLESTGDASAPLSNQEKSGRPRPTIDEPTAFVDTFSFGWLDSVQMLFGAIVAFGIILVVGVAFGWW
ncbi:hypothetical protein EGI31_18555 [Lacihabitans soyangensis]|uniref:Uncharacterized protein n=2 Tax=Lacihabitans soyangensis TaxID=869394 RepID=A0AAE3H6L7_9BACT|nr:hypothetical protein [Lacihabitans soyangensis]